MRAPPGPDNPPILTPEDYEAMAAFRHAIRRYLAFAEAGAVAVGLTSQQHQALLAIKAQTFRRPMSVGDLASELLIRHHSAVGLVARLEKAGYVAKEPDPEDRRRALVSLTSAGQAVLSALSANNLRVLQTVAPTFSGLLTQLEKMDQE